MSGGMVIVVVGGIVVETGGTVVSVVAGGTDAVAVGLEVEGVSVAVVDDGGGFEVVVVMLPLEQPEPASNTVITTSAIIADLSVLCFMTSSPENDIAASVLPAGLNSYKMRRGIIEIL